MVCSVLEATLVVASPEVTVALPAKLYSAARELESNVATLETSYVLTPFWTWLAETTVAPEALRPSSVRKTTREVESTEE